MCEESQCARVSRASLLESDANRLARELFGGDSRVLGVSQIFVEVHESRLLDTPARCVRSRGLSLEAERFGPGSMDGSVGR